MNERDIQMLSRRVLEYEDPGFDDAAWDEWLASSYPLVGHPMVTELSDKDETAPGAALAYLAEGSESDVSSLIRWMWAGAYKGLFISDAEFCEEEFTDALDDYFEQWGEQNEVGFPPTTISDAIDWEDIAYKTFEREGTFYSVAVTSGVYVFDLRKDIEHYRDHGLGVCQWFALCDRSAVKLLEHPAFPNGVPACQRCADKDARLSAG